MQAAGISADEPTAVGAEPSAASTLEPQRGNMMQSAGGDMGPGTGATSTLDLGSEPAAMPDVQDGMGMRTGATPVKVMSPRLIMSYRNPCIAVAWVNTVVSCGCPYHCQCFDEYCCSADRQPLPYVFSKVCILA